MSSYDSWLSKQADAYWEPCEPERDRDGEYTTGENCENADFCDLWQLNLTDPQNN